MFLHLAFHLNSNDVTDRTPKQHNILKTQDHWMKTTGDLCGTTQVLEKVQQMFAQKGGKEEDNSSEENFNIDDFKSDPSEGNDHCKNVKTEEHHTGSNGQAMTYSSDNGAIPTKNNFIKLRPTQSKTDQERSIETSLNSFKPTKCQMISKITSQNCTETRQAEIGELLPVEYKGIAFFLDSCQEAVEFDAALLAVNETGARQKSAENTSQTFLKREMKLKRILNCVVL